MHFEYRWSDERKYSHGQPSRCSAIAKETKWNHFANEIKPAIKFKQKKGEEPKRQKREENRPTEFDEHLYRYSLVLFASFVWLNSNILFSSAFCYFFFYSSSSSSSSSSLSFVALACWFNVKHHIKLENTRLKERHSNSIETKWELKLLSLFQHYFFFHSLENKCARQRKCSC